MTEVLKICRGQDLDLHAMVRDLTAQGYQRVGRVSDPGEIAVRGGLLDVFPEGFEAPVRIEFDHRTVEKISSVHPATGQPFLSHEILVLLPAVPIHRRSLRSPLSRHFLGEDSPIDPFVDIHFGDWVVHVTHGIGRYLGLKKVRTRQQVEEHLVIEYAEGDKLYIPLRELHLIQRYIGFEGRPPKPSKLGTKYWERVKEGARRGAASVAAELLEIQAKRLSAPGHACKPDTDWQRQLEGAFPYRETPGQTRAAEEVKRDMESPLPMDRLLCGDVGYGKTEVALRAVFKAVMEGKQAALLCPTTILAEQHFAAFTERMRSFPVEVGMLSRFQSPAAQRRTLEGLAKGQMDVVIGTHRLLSPDIKFKDLGLLIVDEEQRFGVRHKERLKRLRSDVDVLTMTATPIPRTLYQALMGARAMSLIDTPPFERLPVRTEVAEESGEKVKAAIRHELERKGQVFVIYPWIEGIPKIHQKITVLLPEARVVVAHGQMPSRALEQAMLRFMRHEADILISTSIVESGIDIPNANTLIVYRSEHFGLADLYQLRGRVGRFTRQAHALFLTPKGFPLTEEARKRLRALEQFSSLGAGFQIALQDLQLRGAGNLLGTEQHGHIVTVGFDLYCRLLRSEIDRLKSALTGLPSVRAHGTVRPMLSRNRVLPLLALLGWGTVSGIAGCGSSGKAAAVVNGHVITAQEVEDRFARLNPTVRQQIGEDRSRLLDQLISETLLVQEATRRGLERDGEVRKLLVEARRQVLMGRLLEVVQEEKRGSVSDQEVSQYYETQHGSFVQPEGWRASHILVADEATAQKAISRIKGGEPFATVAKGMSSDPSRDRGGDIGFFAKGQVIPEFEEACRNLKPGEVSQGIKSSLGYHVIQLTEQRAARQRTLEEVKEQIRQVLESQRGQRGVEDFLKELRSKGQVKIRDGAAEPAKAGGSSSP